MTPLAAGSPATGQTCQQRDHVTTVANARRIVRARAEGDRDDSAAGSPGLPAALVTGRSGRIGQTEPSGRGGIPGPWPDALDPPGCPYGDPGGPGGGGGGLYCPGCCGGGIGWPYCCCGWCGPGLLPLVRGHRLALTRLAELLAGARCLLVGPLGGVGQATGQRRPVAQLRQQRRTANSRIAAATMTASSGKIEKPTEKRVEPGKQREQEAKAVRPTVTQPRGKPTLKSVKAGSSAQTVASNNSTNAKLTRLLPVNPLKL